MKQKLSWKILLPLGIVLYLITRSQIFGIVGDALGVLGAIVFLLGIVDAIRSLFSRKEVKSTKTMADEKRKSEEEKF